MNGFTLVATYKYFERDFMNNWKCHTADCYQNGDECVIRLYDSSSRYGAYNLYYQSKSAANSKIISLIKMGYRREKMK